MRVKILNEQGYYEALFGVGLSYGLTSDKELLDLKDSDWKELSKIANKLYNKQGGHNKFLESIQMWIDITAPRYWWQEFATYRVGTSIQSESTIHSGLKNGLSNKDFVLNLPNIFLKILNMCIASKNLIELKALLPEGFLQRRIVNTNYKVLQNIISQRKNHKLSEWHVFIDSIMRQAKYAPFFLRGINEKKKN